MTTTHDQPPALICVDWGSSNFRAFLLDAEGAVLDSTSAASGMLKLSQDQFEPILMQHITHWLEVAPLPVLMAGMVGSQQGWHEAGYVSCPATLSALVDNLYWVPNAANLKLAIVPGMNGQSIAGQPDVMRGEEVQIFGALSLLQHALAERRNEQSDDHALLCLPGTHTKWARIDKASQQHAQVLDFSTQMTGELYSVLNQHSILGRMRKNKEPQAANNTKAFDRGVSCSQGSGGLLHHLFSARTHVLAETLSSSDVDSYLSGLLLGSEVKEMLAQLPATQIVYVVGNDALNARYSHTLEKLGVNACCINGDRAAYTGMLTIARQAGLTTQE